MGSFYFAEFQVQHRTDRGDKVEVGDVILYLQEITWIIGILSFVGGIAIFLFKKIVIEPLQRSIDALNNTLQEFKMSTDKQLEIHDKEIDLLKIKAARIDEQIKTLFRKVGKCDEN